MKANYALTICLLLSVLSAYSMLLKRLTTQMVSKVAGNDQRWSQTPQTSSRAQQPAKKYDNKTPNGQSEAKYKVLNNRPDMKERIKQVDRILLSLRKSDSAATLNDVFNLYKITLTDINHAITTAGRLGRLNDAVEIFTNIHRLGYKADLMSYNNIIWCCGNAGRVDLAERFFQTLLKTPPLRPNVYSYGALMHAYAKTKRAEAAFVLLKKMKEEYVMPNHVVFTSAMEACVEGGKVREAMDVLSLAEESGLVPDSTMINSAIKACCLGGKIGEAEHLAQRLREREEMDLFTYHTLMMGLTKGGGYHKVLALYDEAVESHIQLDGGVYSLAMYAALHSKFYSLVVKISEQAHDADVPLTLPSYTLLIQALGELGAVTQAIACLDRMREDNLKPNEFIYAAAISACKNRGEEVLALLARMEKEGVQKNIVVLTAAISVLGKAGENYPEKAYELWQDMEKNGPTPNMYTYNTLARTFAEGGRIQEALSVLDHVKERKLLPDQYTFTTLLVACGRAGRAEEVSQVMSLMREHRIAADDIAYGAAIDAYRRANSSMKAVQVLQDMLAAGQQPAVSHINLVLRALKAEGKVDMIYKMVLTLEHKQNIRLNSNTFELVIESLLDTPNRFKQIVMLIHTMEKNHFKLSLDNCVRFVQYLESHRQYRIALGMYKYMIEKEYEFYENKIFNDLFVKMIKLAGLKSDWKQAVDLKDIVREIEEE